MLLTILDRTVNASRTVEALFDMALLNGLGITDDVAQDVQLLFTGTDYEVVTIKIKKTSALGITGRQNIKTHQKLTDFVTQFSGTMEALFEVALMNGKSITEEINAGTSLLVNVKDKDVTNFYNDAKATDIITSYNAQAVPGGIGYMQISTSFIVS
jgi:hypothetical protein